MLAIIRVNNHEHEGLNYIKKYYIKKHVCILVVKNFKVRINDLQLSHILQSLYTPTAFKKDTIGHIESHCRERVKQIIISCPQDAIMNKGKQTRAQAVC